MKTRLKPNIILAYLSFSLSGILIFSPLHRAENIIASLCSALITSLLCLLLILRVFAVKKSVTPSKTAAVISALLSSFCCLMLITEIIKDVSFVTGRGISLYYYVFLACAVLAVSLYLCLSGEKGIFRFCILSSLFFIFLLFISFSGFATSKSFIFDGNSLKAGIASSAARGSITGLFITSDSVLFIYCFDEFLRGKSGKLHIRSVFVSFTISFILIISYYISTSLIFGQSLTKELSDPDYALAKLLPGIDFTEAISALRILSFLIKSSVYIFCTSKIYGLAFVKKESTQKKGIIIQYLLLPITAALLIPLDKSHEYGAFQILIYPSVILLSLILIIIYSFFKNKSA